MTDHTELVMRLRYSKHLPYTEDAADAIEALQSQVREYDKALKCVHTIVGTPEVRSLIERERTRIAAMGEKE